MIYGYLADTALAPLGMNNTTYQVYSANGTGVGQVTERVMSMLNTNRPIDVDSTEDPAPGLLIDPRTATSNTRRPNLFSGPSIPAQLRAAGTMSIHYDRYLAHTDAAGSSDLDGNLIDTVENTDELAALFNVIETITMSHVYDINSGIWEYRSKEYLESALSGYSTEVTGYGYVRYSLELPGMATTDKHTRVRNISNESSTIKDTLGSDTVASVAPVYFPDVISFSFKFSTLSEKSTFRLYLNPEAMMRGYDRTTITHVVMPLSPEDLCTPGLIISKTSLETLDMSSAYVADMLSGSSDSGSIHDAVFSSDITHGTNYTGSVSRQTAYMDRSTNVKFACIYKGRTPTSYECYHAINEALVKRLISEEGGGMTEEEARSVIASVFPDMLSSEQYTIIPFYDSIVTSSISSAYTYARDAFSLAYINKLLRKAQNDVANCDAYTTIIDIPGYDMHAIAISSEPTEDAGSATVISEKGLDSNEEFSSYQPLSATDTRWITMTNEAKRLAECLSIIVGAEIMGTAISSSNLSYSIESQTIGGVRCNMIVFSIGSATFAVMQKGSYINFVADSTGA